MLRQDLVDVGKITGPKTVVGTLEILDSAFHVTETDIDIEGWQGNKRFNDALKETFQLAFEEGLNIHRISIETYKVK